MRSHWFLPETPDVLGTLAAQADVTVRGLAAFAPAWAHGDAAQGPEVQGEHEADGVRRTLQTQLRHAFSTDRPGGPVQSLRAAGRGDQRREEHRPGGRRPRHRSGRAVAAMAGDLVEGMGHLRLALDHLTGDGDTATMEADAALAAERRMEKVYRRAMRDLGVSRGRAPGGVAAGVLPARARVRRAARGGRRAGLVRGGQGGLSSPPAASRLPNSSRRRSPFRPARRRAARPGRRPCPARAAARPLQDAHRQQAGVARLADPDACHGHTRGRVQIDSSESIPSSMGSGTGTPMTAIEVAGARASRAGAPHLRHRR